MRNYYLTILTNIFEIGQSSSSQFLGTVKMSNINEEELREEEAAGFSSTPRPPAPATPQGAMSPSMEVFFRSQSQDPEGQAAWRDMDIQRPPPSYGQWREAADRRPEQDSDQELDAAFDVPQEYSAAESRVARAATPQLSSIMAAPMLFEHGEGSARTMHLSTPRVTHDRGVSPIIAMGIPDKWSPISQIGEHPVELSEAQQSYQPSWTDQPGEGIRTNPWVGPSQSGSAAGYLASLARRTSQHEGSRATPRMGISSTMVRPNPSVPAGSRPVLKTPQRDWEPAPPMVLGRSRKVGWEEPLTHKEGVHYPEEYQEAASRTPSPIKRSIQGLGEVAGEQSQGSTWELPMVPSDSRRPPGTRAKRARVQGPYQSPPQDQWSQCAQYGSLERRPADPQYSDQYYSPEYESPSGSQPIEVKPIPQPRHPQGYHYEERAFRPEQRTSPGQEMWPGNPPPPDPIQFPGTESEGQLPYGPEDQFYDQFESPARPRPQYQQPYEASGELLPCPPPYGQPKLSTRGEVGRTQMRQEKLAYKPQQRSERKCPKEEEDASYCKVEKGCRPPTPWKRTRWNKPSRSEHFRDSSSPSSSSSDDEDDIWKEKRARRHHKDDTAGFKDWRGRRGPSSSSSTEDTSTSSDEGSWVSRTTRRRNHKRRHSIRSKKMELPTYDGKNSIVDYLTQASLIIESNGWSSKVSAKHLAAALRGDATEVLGILGKKRASKYSTLARALTRQFNPEGQEPKYAIQLMTAKYVPGSKQDLPAYARGLQRLSKKAYPGARISNRQMCDYFCHGLPKGMRRQVQVQRPSDLNDAVCIALTYEAAADYSEDERGRVKKPKHTEAANVIQGAAVGRNRRKSRPKKAANTTPEGMVNAVTPTPGDNSNMLQMMTNLTDVMERLNKQSAEQAEKISAMEKRLQRRPRSEVTCYNCNVKGHYSSECQEPRRPGTGQRLSPQAPSFRPQNRAAMVEQEMEGSADQEN